MGPTVRLLILAVAALAFPALASAAFVARTTTIDIDGHVVALDVYEPGVRPVGVAIVAHGWTRSRERHRDAGRALAEAGVVAIVPDLPNVVDLWGNGTLIVDLARAPRGRRARARAGRALVDRADRHVGRRARDRLRGLQAARPRRLGGPRPGRPHRHRHVRRLPTRRARDRAARRHVRVQPVRERAIDRDARCRTSCARSRSTARRTATSRRRPTASAP